MNLPDTIHRVFPDLHRLDYAPTLDDAGIDDREALFSAYVEDLTEAEALDLVELEFNDYLDGVKAWLITGYPQQFIKIREKLIHRNWAEINEAIEDAWHTARQQERYG